MRKAACSSGGMDSSNPRRWRDGQLCHHGDSVCRVFLLFVRSHNSCLTSLVLLTVLLFVPHWRAPHLYPVDESTIPVNIFPGFCSDSVNLCCFLKAQTAEICLQCPIKNVFICVNEDYYLLLMLQPAGNCSNKDSPEQLPW